MKIKLSCLILALALAVTGQAKAAPIDYIFNGMGTGDLNGAAFSGNFNVTYIGDTTGVFDFGGGILANNTPIGSFFSTSTLNASFSSGISLRLNTDPAGPIVFFGQNQPAPVNFVAEGTGSSSLASYDLKTDFPLTIGTPSFSNQSFQTTLGNLTFSSISALSFQAIRTGDVASTPLPDALPMFAAALMGLGFIAYQRRRA
jgi:hypothetical protein